MNATNVKVENITYFIRGGLQKYIATGHIQQKMLKQQQKMREQHSRLAQPTRSTKVAIWVNPCVNPQGVKHVRNRVINLPSTISYNTNLGKAKRAQTLENDFEYDIAYAIGAGICRLMLRLKKALRF